MCLMLGFGDFWMFLFWFSIAFIMTVVVLKNFLMLDD